MAPSKEQVLSYIQAREKKAREAEITNNFLRSAAVQSEKLTGDEKWDSFLRRLQPILDDATKSKVYWLDQMGDAYDELNRGMRQAEYLKARAVEETLKMVMALPHEIIKEHRAAS